MVFLWMKFSCVFMKQGCVNWMFNFDLNFMLSFHSIKLLNEVKLYCVLITFVSIVYRMSTTLRINVFS